MRFEALVAEANPSCEIHIFDNGAYGLSRWFPDAAVRQRVHFHHRFISRIDDPRANPPRQTLESIMREVRRTLAPLQPPPHS